MRELHARDVAGEPAAIEAAQQLWYVRQTTTDRRGEIVAVEQRYFVTSIPTGALTRDEGLALVRLHWGIENGCHWTLDVVLGEDDGHPCQASRASIETVSWLRLIGYNALSAWRTLAPRKDGKPLAWARAAETLRDALLVAQVTELTAAVTRTTGPPAAPSSLRADSTKRPAADAAGRPASRRLERGAATPVEVNPRQRGSGLGGRAARRPPPDGVG